MKIVNLTHECGIHYNYLKLYRARAAAIIKYFRQENVKQEIENITKDLLIKDFNNIGLNTDSKYNKNKSLFGILDDLQKEKLDRNIKIFKIPFLIVIIIGGLTTIATIIIDGIKFQ